MKIILLSFFVFTTAGSAHAEWPGLLPQQQVREIVCGDYSQVQSHMSQMGRLIFDLGDFVEEVLQDQSNPDVKNKIMERAQLLRVHLSAVMVKNPPKLNKIVPGNPQLAQLIFQQYINRVIAKTIELEMELVDDKADPFSTQAQKVKIAGLLVEINEVVNEAHQAFRQ